MLPYNKLTKPARVASSHGSAPIDTLTGLDTGQGIIVETMQAYHAEAKEGQPCLLNTWYCKRRRRLVRSPA
jgi:hypothetical protein